jgi:hypothetical protein
MTVPDDDITSLVCSHGHMLQAPAIAPPSPTCFIPCSSPQWQAYDDYHGVEKQK